MNLRQLEYILKIAEENNITKAAEKLFITQPALNQQLLNLEKELGTQLFHRSRTNWHPTKAGVVYIENARKILQLKREAYNQISDIADTKKGYLSVGFTPARGAAMFTYIYPLFHMHYPDISLVPKDISVKKQQMMINSGELDIGFMTLTDKQKTTNTYITICPEEFLIAIPISHPLAKLANPPGKPFATLDLKMLKDEPFALMYKESTAFELVESFFKKAGFEPKVLFETSNPTTIVTMIKSHLCCGLIPYYFAKNCFDDIACFSLPGKPSWDIVASHKKNTRLSNAAKLFIELAFEFWNNEFANSR
ncbi:MAG TPA: transcriptional regulator [Eubacteriaceae bacterium]|jgi:DNA-binding transcriptional LysR family regulator|nr:transcriptional regulator [Eubacteriaceae bacterium]